MKIRKIANYSTGASSDSLPIGSIISFSSNSIPSNYLLCDGSAISRKQYKQLFDIIGITYGAGDGSTTFNLPDLKGKVITGLNSEDEDFNILGKIGGEKTHKLKIEELPIASFKASGSSGDWTYVGVSSTKPHNNLQPYIVTNYIIKAFDDINVNGEVLNQQSNSQKDTYSCDYINKKSKYSTEEQIVGEWIDGKPIYRKVFFNYFNSVYNNWYSIGNISNLKTAVKVEGMIKQKDDGNFINFPRCSIFDNASSDLYINGSTGEVNIRIGKATGELYLIVEYTKTTD